MSNIIKIPITMSQRIKNQRGKTSVDCIISDRWLKLSHTSELVGGYGDVFFLDVMTTNDDNIDKKICQLAISKEELLDALSNVKCVGAKEEN